MSARKNGQNEVHARVKVKYKTTVTQFFVLTRM